MRSWQEYKNTMTEELPQFIWAREGNLIGLKSLELDLELINRKNFKGHSALMLAAYNGHEDVVEWLISQGADVISIDDSSNSILMGVAFKGHLSILNMLLRNHANSNYSNEKGQTALDYAQMFGRTEIVKKLKSIHNQPEVFGFQDFLKSWISAFNKKGVRS